MTHNPLTTAERLELQQLLQIDFWSKRERSESYSESYNDKPPPSATENGSALSQRWELTRGIDLHSWQAQCVDTWFDAGKRGVLKVVTGAGRTILALAIAEKLQQAAAPDLRVAKRIFEMSAERDFHDRGGDGLAVPCT